MEIENGAVFREGIVGLNGSSRADYAERAENAAEKASISLDSPN